LRFIRYGSIATEIQCPCHVCFPSDSDQIADVTPRRRRAKKQTLKDYWHFGFKVAIE
jgi:hypothetical protein